MGLKCSVYDAYIGDSDGDVVDVGWCESARFLEVVVEVWTCESSAMSLIEALCAELGVSELEIMVEQNCEPCCCHWYSSHCSFILFFSALVPPGAV
jgi:hypothetical protein